MPGALVGTARVPSGSWGRRDGPRLWQRQGGWRARARAGAPTPGWGQHRVPGTGSQSPAWSGGAASCTIACAAYAVLREGLRRGPVGGRAALGGAPRAPHRCLGLYQRLSPTISRAGRCLRGWRRSVTGQVGHPRRSPSTPTRRWRRRATAYAFWRVWGCPVWPAPQLGR